MGARRAFGQLPFVAEQRIEVAVVPLDRVGRPSALNAAGGRVGALARARAVAPAEPLLDDVRSLRFGADQRGVAGAVALAERVSAGHQRHGLLIVHGHSAEGLANVPARGEGIRIAVRPLRVDVDEAHLDCAERIVERPLAGVALIAEPLGLGAPVDVRFRFPDVLAPAAEAEGLEPHRLQRAVAGQDHEISPGELAAILLLDWPQQHARLVEVGVVRPTVERRKALGAGAGAAASVADPVGARAVPSHADEERAVVAEIGWPPILRIGHQFVEVTLDGVEIKALELGGVVKLRIHGARQGRMLVQNVKVQPVRPPVPV